MKIKCYYNRNIRLTEGKLSAQIGHVTKELGRMVKSNAKKDIIIVLKLSRKKFYDKLEEVNKKENFYAHVDMGLTEVDPGTITAFGYIEQ